MILMHINNHAKHIRTRQSNLPTSSRFPLVSWPCDPCCYTNWDRSGSACNFSGSCHVDSRSVCQILPGAPRDLWEVCHAGVLSRCPTATYGIGTKEGKSWEHICCSPKIFPHVVLFFPDDQMFKVSHVFHHLFPSFSPFLSSMFSHFSPMKFTISGEAKPWWNFPSSEMVSRLRFRLHDKILWITCVLRKDPKRSERPEICDVAHSELDMIGHLRCEWIRFRLFDMNRHSESIWHHWNIYNL